ncbi:magnesium ion transporter [Pichia californica]|uniref:Magnesium transporter n=1 Tax=Pichia californica TaxID=460514 RepID=A0A9P7BEA3_9ASCO|nr:magnesium ion transporter [[Candida] californica]KAG0689087.1 magnesium ion transporter [[Candida] californica]
MNRFPVRVSVSHSVISSIRIKQNSFTFIRFSFAFTSQIASNSTLTSLYKQNKGNIYNNLINQNRFFSTPSSSSIISSSSKVLKPISPDVSTISCTVIDGSGTVRAVSKKFPRALFLQQNKLFPRDLRKIDSSNVDVAPSIAVRSNGILINLLHIKALIKRNEVLVFDTASPDAAGKLSLFMYDLESKLQTKVVHGGMLGLHGNQAIVNQNYEFKALECILVNVMAVLETELRRHLERIDKILNELDSQIDRANLKDLLVNSKGLTMFYQKSLLIRNTLDEVLDNDEDLENMYLTENYEIKRLICDNEVKPPTTPNTSNATTTTANKGKTENITDKTRSNLGHSSMHDSVADSVNSNNRGVNSSLIQQGSESRDTGEVEMLLEAYYKQCDEIVQQAETMINNIKSTEDIVNIILDANRNSLMVFELRVAIFTLGFTIATVIPAFYGMNLRNYIEESNVAFFSVVALSLAMGGIMSVIYLRRLRDVRRMTMVSSKQLDKFDEKTKRNFLDKIREQKSVRSLEKQKKKENDIVWKWLIDEHK